MSTFERYARHYCEAGDLGIALDISRMDFGDDFFARMEGPMQCAFEAMEELEGGAIANPDEKRMVGHYWLRDADRAPKPELRDTIRKDLADLSRFVSELHAGRIASQRAGRFQNVLTIGIGGSALGPQLVADALTQPGADKMKPFFFDNTDPDGMRRELARLGVGIERTVTLIISKSGGTPETRNGMLVARAAYEHAHLDFGRHAVAVTGVGSALDRYAQDNQFLARFPMYDWVGGRTSLWGAVGLLPGMLQLGEPMLGMLDGARRMDAATRVRVTASNPAALLALMWHHATGGRGDKDMVVLPYSDRLLLFSRYLQQLVMESLGKERDLDGKVVRQGIAVYGNKGSTDQHAYVQQLRDGVPNFFAVFVEALAKDSESDPVTRIAVEPEVTCGDYLNGLLIGTRRALHENGRQSMTITVPRVNAETLGALIALFERAVGFYATLVNVNAYHQPGVEAGKKAAARVLEIQRALMKAMRASKGTQHDATEWAAAAGMADEAEAAFMTLRHLANNSGAVKVSGSGPSARFWCA